jgi:hypothetical protein
MRGLSHNLFVTAGHRLFCMGTIFGAIQKSNTVDSAYKNTVGPGKCILIECLFLHTEWLGTSDRR